jgi:MFS family permease
MLKVLANPVYRTLFAAQIVALIGTGLLTVALGLLAFDLAGGDAGAVLGTALAIKMIAYVTIAPVAQALAERLPRKRVLITLDLVRAGVALFLPFVTDVWQVYVLIFVLQSASAGFTPAFQTAIPDILPDERDYTRALSLSRLAYDLESLASPLLAALLLAVIGYNDLFTGTVAGFLASAALVALTPVPDPRPDLKPGPPRTIWSRTTRGIVAYLATPRLRGLLALNMAVAAAGAMVFVNTVVIVQAELGLAQGDVALALAAFGAGSMVAALALPRLLDSIPDRALMLAAAAMLPLLTLAGTVINSFAGLAVLWAAIGIAYAAVQTPTGRLLRRSGGTDIRPALFAAQFALSHACWLVAYPMAGWLGASFGMPTTFAVHAGLAAASVLAAFLLWPAAGERAAAHAHPDLPADHPHLREHGAASHAHAPMADELHENLHVAQFR